MLKYIIDIRSSEMRLNTFVAQTIFILRAKLWKVAIKCKNVMFFNFWPLFLEIYILDVAYYFLPSTYPANSIFSVVAWIYMIHFSDKAFFPPFSHCYCDWECLFFLFPLQRLLRKQISSTQLCSLSI